jgi:16S rRNA (uracil1498-N3)-methyltransferase
MNRLHIPRPELQDATVTITGDALSYLRDVLRIRPGALIEVFDGEGGIYASAVAQVSQVSVVIDLGPREERPFRGVRVTLLQGLPKADKFELVVQKAVELGVTSIVPVMCERSIVKLDERKAVERVIRWQRIADEAARQCQRADVVVVSPVIAFGHLPGRPTAVTDCRLLLDEEEHSTRLQDALRGADATYQLLIGPEGGLTREEVALARSAGFVPVTLGPRILRTETAGLAALAILQHRLGDLG